MRAAWVHLLVVCVIAATAAASCGGEDKPAAGVGGVGAEGQGAAGGGDLFGSGGSVAMGLEIEPADATIVVDDGVSVPLQLVAKKDGQVVYPTKWTVDFGTIAEVDSAGLVAATNLKGGKVTVSATYEGTTGSASVTVQFHKTVNPAGIPADLQDALRNATTQDPSIAWAYPYDGTVWPTELLAPEMMWNNGAPGDVYLLHYQGSYVDIEVFTSADPPSRYQVEQPDWVAINESGSGGDGVVDFHVARLTNGNQDAYSVLSHSWKMSRGSLKGTVYYWANSLGRVVRIKPGESQPDDFLAAAGVTQCTTCHTVSADGRTLVLGGDAPQSTFDLLSNTTLLNSADVGKPVRNWAMPALSPDGRFLVENNAPLPGPPGGSDGMWDPATGLKLSNTGLEGAYLDMPAFGPLGHKLAYVDHGGSHDLAVYDFDLANGVASNPQPLVAAGGDPNLNAICFPSVSPTITQGEGDGSTYVVYHRGQYPNSLDTRSGPGDLYLASADEPGKEWRLAAANGDGYPFAAGGRDLSHNYEPTFAPVAAGGYLWVVFTSRRTYGNRLTGDTTVVKQLWVAAIDPFPKAGEDPSHPAFWVRGQDPATLNMRGFWALDPCIPSGDSCSTDADCCDGRSCESGTCGGAEECVPALGECLVDDDCCDPSLSCIAGICDTAGPQ